MNGYDPLIPIASNRKNANTSTAPFKITPVIIKGIFLEAIANIIPATESTVNTTRPIMIFAFGPLVIKKKTILKRTVSKDKIPHGLFLVKVFLLHKQSKLDSLFLKR